MRHGGNAGKLAYQKDITIGRILIVLIAKQDPASRDVFFLVILFECCEHHAMGVDLCRPVRHIEPSKSLIMDTPAPTM